MRWLSWLLSAAVALAASSSHAHAQSPDDVAMAKRFVGTWRLVSWTKRHADGTTQQNPGDGYVSRKAVGRCVVLRECCLYVPSSQMTAWKNLVFVRSCTDNRGCLGWAWRSSTWVFMAQGYHVTV
jgi:hypothetical protein